MQNNYRFHFQIYRQGNAPTILHLVELMWLQYRPSMRLIYSRWGNSASDLDHHRAVLEALERGDGRAFRASIEADIEQGIGLLLRRLCPRSVIMGLHPGSVYDFYSRSQGSTFLRALPGTGFIGISDSWENQWR